MQRQHPWLLVVLVGAVIGVVFAGISTYDFVQHLDRQVHSLHCSFIPGVTHAGESGCQVAMMSPYSSVLRGRLWGGVPISLPALSVFAFLVFYALDLAVTRRRDDPRATGFLALATVLPAVASVVMLAISLSQLGTTCKLCVCIYAASAVCLVGAVVAWRRAVRAAGGSGGGFEPLYTGRPDEPAFVGRAKTASGHRLVAVSGGGTSGGTLAAAFVIGVAFVGVPVALYFALAPDHARFIGTCEGLPRGDDPYGVMLRIERGGASKSAAPAIEVLDPLCPACKAFEQRLQASGLAEQLDRKAVLFPLDNTCNWMVTEATHPGACTVSEAVLCAGAKAPDVIAWAFEVQDRIRSETRADPAAAARIVKQRFPELAACVGSPEARSRLNKSLRWIVANNIRVLTPQLFVDKVKLCDEDVDLGLEYTLSAMLDRRARGALTTEPLEKPPAAARPAADKAGAK
ncbi:MAG TPA: vitamin K epoxide reductase family protein [Kofleriaceae bacterium]|nr:vitamin K epoxide reductase family protein [Kofleriaceae bacterium]